MTWRRRLLILKAVLFDTWHQKVCCECGGFWWAVGPHHAELIHLCDDCESLRINAMMEFHEAEYQRLKAEGVIW